ncbi:hypothetical protein KAU33_01705 [Candidatus Dependentiae bacterium]|nr:hypothetical protein [Candidatus Dependentiae bacterium]
MLKYKNPKLLIVLLLLIICTTQAFQSEIEINCYGRYKILLNSKNYGYTKPNQGGRIIRELPSGQYEIKLINDKLSFTKSFYLNDSDKKCFFIDDLEFTIPLEEYKKMSIADSKKLFLYILSKNISVYEYIHLSKAGIFLFESKPFIFIGVDVDKNLIEAALLYHMKKNKKNIDKFPELLKYKIENTVNDKKIVILNIINKSYDYLLLEDLTNKIYLQDEYRRRYGVGVDDSLDKKIISPALTTDLAPKKSVIGYMYFPLICNKNDVFAIKIKNLVMEDGSQYNVKNGEKHFYSAPRTPDSYYKDNLSEIVLQFEKSELQLLYLIEIGIPEVQEDQFPHQTQTSSYKTSYSISAFDFLSFTLNILSIILLF